LQAETTGRKWKALLDEKNGDVTDAELKGSFGHGVLSRGAPPRVNIMPVIDSNTKRYIICFSENEDGTVRGARNRQGASKLNILMYTYVLLE
jgi:hypothetical protein